VKIEDTIVMGADYYDEYQRIDPLGCRQEIRSGSALAARFRGDHHKNARIGRDVIIRPFPRGTDLDGINWVVRDGIVVIPKGAIRLRGP
jgi:glucose-1-phosphate adenylyltransferase